MTVVDAPDLDPLLDRLWPSLQALYNPNSDNNVAQAAALFTDTIHHPQQLALTPERIHQILSDVFDKDLQQQVTDKMIPAVMAHVKTQQPQLIPYLEQSLDALANRLMALAQKHIDLSPVIRAVAAQQMAYLDCYTEAQEQLHGPFRRSSSSP